MTLFMFHRRLRLYGFVILLGIVSEAWAVDDSWYFTAGEIEAAYRYQHSFGRRLRYPLRPQDCYLGKAEFTASFRGKEFSVPCSFIHKTTRHLKSILEQGAAKYLFPLDADHAHLVIPRELWREKYSRLDAHDFLPSILREPALIALYHTAEHLSTRDREGALASPQIRQWKAKRNILGYYDGRPLTVLPPKPDGAGQELPENYQTVSAFYFLAYRFGEFTLSANGKAQSFDLSFDNDFAE